MKQITNLRILAYIELVKEREASEVIQTFLDLLDKCNNVDDADLRSLLSEARDVSPNAKERKELEQAIRNSVLQHCNS